MRLFNGSWSFGRWRGMDIRLHFSMVFSLPIAYLLFQPVDVRGVVEAFLWVTGLAVFIFLHELGHAFAAQLVGVPVKSVIVWLLGGLTNLAHKPEKPMHNLFIYAAGPLVNMLLAFVCVAFYMLTVMVFLPFSSNHEMYIWLQTFQNLFFSLAIVNLILIVFNLIPIYPLDGGAILHAGMEWLFGRTNADRITLIVGIPLLVLLVGVAIYLRDYVLLFFCVLIAISISSLSQPLLKAINLGLAYLFKRAAYYYLKGDYERAAQLYTAEIEKQPNVIGSYLARAGAYLAMGQTARTLADVERALKLNQSHLMALEMRGELYMLEKNYDAALDMFAHAQALNPYWAVPHFDRASLFLERGEYEPALTSFNKAIALQPRMPLFHLVRSLAHFRLGNRASAHTDQDTAVGLSAEDALIMVEVNQLLYEGNLDWARDFYNRILEKNPRNALALHGLADACFANREFANAVDLYTRALTINPREPRLYLGRGKTHLELNESEKAKADFMKVSSVTAIVHLKRNADNLLRSLAISDIQPKGLSNENSLTRN